MSSDILIEATGISKFYKPLELPFIGRTRGQAGVKKALEDVTVQIRRGETIGILGPNGAGKSTLLAVLGNAIPPTHGTVRRNGRIATLLELGAGFDINLSGRENADLFLRMAGTRRKDIEAAICRIADYADIGTYFGMPLRTYSSGMHSRFAFACAINMDADLMIIDETLAVGDIDFRSKCYHTIAALQREGRAFVLVTHNPAIVSRIATRAWVMDAGRKFFDGAPKEAADIYRRLLERGGGGLRSTKDFGRANDTLRTKVKAYSDRTITFEIEFMADRRYSGLNFEIDFSSHTGIILARYGGECLGLRPSALGLGECRLMSLTIDNVFNQGSIIMTVRASEAGAEVSQRQIRLDIDKGGPLKGVADLGLGIAVGSKHGTTVGTNA